MAKEKKKKMTSDEEVIENKANDEELEHLEDEIEEDEDEEEVAELVPVDKALEDVSIPVDEKLDLVKAAWETSEAKAAEYLDGWQRSKAEFANYRKRINREREQYNKDVVGRVVKKYLPIVDDLERALKERPTQGDFATWVEGIELIYRKLIGVLESDGVVPMKVDGEMFDPNLHEAVLQIESEDHESGQIVEVIQPGYWIGERVLRPARVCIAA
jgi:molecular chaperone GrpE